MSIHLPKHPNTIPPSSTEQSPHNISPPHEAAQIKKKESQDLFITASNPSDPLTPTSIEASNPLIAPPQSETSQTDTLRILLDAIRVFRHQLSASAQIDIESRYKLNLLAASQALQLSQILEEKEASIADIEKEIAVILAELDHDLKEMKELAELQQKEIDRINQGNEAEKQAYADLTHAYDEYMNNLMAIGAVNLGNGQFLIPEEPDELLDQYNAITQDYQNAVATFNETWDKRSSELNNYNLGAITYNQKAAEYNGAINDFIEQHNLTDYLKASGLTIPQLTLADTRDISNDQEVIKAPILINGSSTVTIPSLPLDIRSIAQTGPLPLQPLPSFPPFASDLLYEGLYQSMYETRVVPIDQKMMQCNQFNSFMVHQKMRSIDDELSSSDLLKFNTLIETLLAHGDQIKGSNEWKKNILTAQIEELDDPEMSLLLGKRLLQETISIEALKSLIQLNLQARESLIHQITNKLILLSLGLLANQSMQALLPSLGIIVDVLTHLPKDSPAFPILFSISLSNRMLEDIDHGILMKTIDTFLDSLPECSGISPQGKEKIGRIIILGQLMAASKLIEESLGLQGLFAQTLSNASIPLNELIASAEKKDSQKVIKIEEEINNHFIKKGYPQDKATYLGQIGGQLAQRGLLSPHVTGSISEKTVDTFWLKHSIQTALSLSHDYSLEEARIICEKAVLDILSASPDLSAKQFRSEISTYLKDLGVKNYSEIAKTALLIPLKEQSIALAIEPLKQPQLIKEPTSSSIPAYKGLSDERSSIVNNRTLLLLNPQLGPFLAKEIGQEILQTLFGQPHVDSKTISSSSSPDSLTQSITNQIAYLVKDHHEKWMDSVHEAFAESLKNVTSFAQFSKKLQNPAYQYLFASSMIYHNDGKRAQLNLII